MTRWLIALGLGFFAAAPAHALRCGVRLVDEGDTSFEVVAMCGEPAEVERRSSILRRPVVWMHGRPYITGDGYVEIPVEIWIYNLGPHKLMRRLRFEDGRLVDIETLGYGYYVKDPRTAQ